MDKYFKKLIKNISLTKNQREDAIAKYVGVCKSLNNEFYDSEYSDSIKFLFGSYKKKTTISSYEKDVDVIFKIPKEQFDDYREQENGPSNLLTKVKNTLKDTYSTTDKIKNWTKVVLVDFKTFKVEVLPAFENEDGRFTIPNSGEGEDWIYFDPKNDIVDFEESNKATCGLTRDLIKIIKKWKIETGNVDIKTYVLDSYIINFLKNYTFENYPTLIFDFFEYLHGKEKESYVETALNRAKKALSFYDERKIDEASKEYKKIFGEKSFPASIKMSIDDTEYVIAPNEEFIEDIVPCFINKNIELQIETYCKPHKGSFRKGVLLSKLPIGWVKKEDSLEFKIKIDGGINGGYITKWKVRNFGEEAERNGKLRGEILEDNNGVHAYKDGAAFYGEHFLECYLIQDGVCVARKKVSVPISNF